MSVEADAPLSADDFPSDLWWPSGRPVPDLAQPECLAPDDLLADPFWAW